MNSVLPGTTVNVTAQATPAGLPTETGRLFVAGICERGPTEPTVVGGWNTFRQRFGDRTHYTTLTDGLRAFWAAGGGDVVVSRVVGPDAATASVVLQDGDAADTLEIVARDVGSHGDLLEIEVVVDGDTFDLVVFDDDVEVERWSGLEDPSDAADRLDRSRYVRGSDQASASADPNPAAGTFSLEGGDDDRGSISDSDWQDALDRFDAEWGPGQVAAPSREGTGGRVQLVTHAEDHNRLAFLDAEQGASQQDLDTAAADHNTRSAALFAPWLKVTVDGRRRTVPASMVAAGLAARFDAEAPTAHLSPDLGRAQLPSVEDVDIEFDDDAHGLLNGAGVNIFRATRHAGVLLRGWRTLSNEAAWVQLSQSRYIMGLAARVTRIGDRKTFKTLTRPTIASYGNQIAAELKADFDAGALWGDSPEDAYQVDVSSDVNPPEQVQQGELHALATVQVAPFAERVVIDLVKANLS